MARSGCRPGIAQLPAVACARTASVVIARPPMPQSPPRGSRRALALCEAFISHIERKVFPGGCFFSAAAIEVGSRKGPVHDVIVKHQAEWLTLLQRLVDEAQDAGEVSARVDPAQLAFELHALVVGANNAWILSGRSAVLDQARRAVRERVQRAAPAEAA
jgi:hypothetical protein